MPENKRNLPCSGVKAFSLIHANGSSRALKPNRNALWMEVNRLYRRILREQEKPAAADIRQTG